MLFLPKLNCALRIALLAFHMLPKAGNRQRVQGFSTSLTLDIGMPHSRNSFGLLMQILERNDLLLRNLPMMDNIFHTRSRFISHRHIKVRLDHFGGVQVVWLTIGLLIGFFQNLVQLVPDCWILLQTIQPVDNIVFTRSCCTSRL